MNWSFVGQEALAFVFYFLYGSFFEWTFHRYLFHSPKFLKCTFRAHQLIHHQRYKYELDSYEWQEGREKDHVAMNWFALLLFLSFHAPLLWAVQALTGWQSVWGGLAAITAYYAVYEYFHYCMHIPGDRWFENKWPFTFVKEHHRIHHKYMLKNLNVFFPLADACLGTFVSASSLEKTRSKVGSELQKSHIAS